MAYGAKQRFGVTEGGFQQQASADQSEIERDNGPDSA
jgi:hypothetical protein